MLDAVSKGGLSPGTQSGTDTALSMARWAELAWPVVPRPWLAARCCCLLWWTWEEGSFLGLCVLICLLLLPLARIHHMTNILNVNADRATPLLRTLPPFSPLPSEQSPSSSYWTSRPYKVQFQLPFLLPAPMHRTHSKHKRLPTLPSRAKTVSSFAYAVPFP